MSPWKQNPDSFFGSKSQLLDDEYKYVQAFLAALTEQLQIHSGTTLSPEPEDGMGRVMVARQMSCVNGTVVYITIWVMVVNRP